MGGKLLKPIGAIRVDKQTYLHVKSEVEKLVEIFGLKHFVPPDMPNKSSFGDIDIVITGVNDKLNSFRDKIKENWQFKANGHVLSALFKLPKPQTEWAPKKEGLQVDFIFCQEEDFAAYCNFIRWGDFSMVAGRVARMFDLKYGIYGLEKIIRDPETNHEIANISVSKDPEKIMTFLGYDWNKWITGFKTEKQLAEFVFSSPLITRDFLESYEKNAKHRKIDKDRDQYKRFYQYFLSIRDSLPETKPVMPEDESINWIEKHFPESNLRQKVEDVRSAIKKSQAVRNKFSGKEMVEILKSESPNINGKTIGTIIAAFKKSVFEKTGEQWDDYVLSRPISELETSFSNFVAKDFPF